MNTFIKSRIRSFKFAFDGLLEGIRSQWNIRIHLSALFVVVSLGIYFGITRFEWIAMSIVVSMVLSAEYLNTAIEYLADVISPQYHPIIGKAKDLSAAAVLLCAFVAIIVGLFIFIPYFLK